MECCTYHCLVPSTRGFYRLHPIILDTHYFIMLFFFILERKIWILNDVIFGVMFSWIWAAFKITS